MQFRKALTFLSAAAACALMAVAAQADFPNIVQNGSFEFGQSYNYLFTPLVAGTNFLTGWTVAGGDYYNNALDLVTSNYWPAQDGAQSLDMNGLNAAGAISQTLTTVPGQTYKVSFWMAGNPDDDPFDATTIKALQVNTGAQSAVYTFDVAGHTDADLGWVQQTFIYTATSASTVLSFSSGQGASSWGPTLDNVSVSYCYAWSGVLPPLNADGSSVSKAGSTIPVKFALTGASAGIANLQATLSYALVNNGVVGDFNAANTNAAGGGDQFRYDPTSGQYIFNWSTKGLSAGTYLLSIDMGDGVSRTVQVRLK